MPEIPLQPECRSGLSLSLLALAIAVIGAGALPAARAQTTAPVVATPAAGAQSYDIPAGPLVQVVTTFAAQAGIALTFDAVALQGERSPGVRGLYTAQEGLNQVLSASGWAARRAANGAYVLEPRPADAATSSVTLSAIRVQGAGASTEGSGLYGGSATTVFKGDLSIRETPQPVTVLSRQFLDDRVLPDLNDVLQNTPGVTVDYTDSERVNYFSRGHAIDSLQVDGLNLYQGGSTFIQPDTAVLDRVEVLRGAAGVLRGAGNPSATVNMVRKRPTREFQAEASYTLGSWNRHRGEVDISGPLNASGSLRGRLVAVADKKDFFQQARREDRRVLYGVLQADVGPDTTVTATLQHTSLDATGSWGGLPANFDGSQLDLPRDTYLGADWNRWDRYNQQAMLEVEHRLAGEWQVKAAAAYTRFRYGDGFKQTSFSRSSTTNPYLANVSTALYEQAGSDQRAVSVVAEGPVELFGQRHHLTLGAETMRVMTVNSSGYFNIAPMRDVDIRNWNPYTSYPEPFDLSNATWYEAQNNKTRQEALYALARVSLAEPLTALLGVRANWWRYEVPEDSSRDYSVRGELSPYLGLVYDVTRQVSLYGSYSEIFAPQYAYDSSGNLLDPVRGKDFELGIKGEFFEGRLNSALSLFRIDNNGRAMDDPSSADPCLPFYPSGYCKVAGGKTRSEGWELELSGELMPGWNIMAGYTNTRTKYLSDNNANNLGQPIRSADPRHLFRVFTTYRPGGALQGLALGAGVQAQSSTYVKSGAVTATQGGYAVYNLMMGYDFNRHLRVQFNVNNVFDKVYYKKIGASGFNSYYGDPRNFVLTLTARY